MTVLHFRISGDFITEQARSFWADDQEPGKAVALLEAAFPEMKPSIRLAILTGSKRLVGDEHGMDLVDDDAVTTSNGMPLDLVEVTTQLQNKNKEYLEVIRDRTAMDHGETQVIGTPQGGMRVPAHRVQQIKSGEVQWDQVLHEPLAPLSNYVMSGRYPGPTDDPDPIQSELPPPVPVEPQDQITTDNGWLDPEGHFYPCLYGGHNHVLYTLNLSEGDADQRGWIKLSTSMSPELSDLPGRGISIWSRLFGRPTQIQIDRVFDRFNWLPEWMKDE